MVKRKLSMFVTAMIDMLAEWPFKGYVVNLLAKFIRFQKEGLGAPRLQIILCSLDGKNKIVNNGRKITLAQSFRVLQESHGGFCDRSAREENDKKLETQLGERDGQIYSQPIGYHHLVSHTFR